MPSPPHETALGYHTACDPRGTRITEHLVSLLRIFEAFSLHCFRTRTPYFVDSGTLLGCVRHRGIIPWDNDIDVAMFTRDFVPFLDGFSQAASEASGLILDRHGYQDPNGCVWFRDERSGAAGLDLSAYEDDGRSLMRVSVQREWPIDAWKTDHDADSWKYDFGPDDLRDFVVLPSYCGPQRAPRAWPHRLARHYDNLDIDAGLREQAASELPFDPAVAPVQLVNAYATLAEGLNSTTGRRPFEIPDPGMSIASSSSTEPSSSGEMSPAGTEATFVVGGAHHACHRLLQGERYWWFFEPESAPASWLATRSITEIVTSDAFVRWGRVHVLHQRAGSTVVFPATWPARAHTLEDAMGTMCDIRLPAQGDGA